MAFIACIVRAFGGVGAPDVLLPILRIRARTRSCEDMPFLDNRNGNRYSVESFSEGLQAVGDGDIRRGLSMNCRIDSGSIL